MFPDEPLAHNPVAKGFGLIADLQQPLAIGYDTVDGPKSFSDLTNKVRVLALWADWCPPCLQEMPELAVLQTRYGDDDFEFVAILTGDNARRDFATARAALDDAGAQALPLWVEPRGGGQTLALAIPEIPEMLVQSDQMTTGPNIPCAVLVDKKGMVRGHSIGLQSAPRAARDPGTPRSSEQMWPSIWTTPDADTFIEALKAGALS
jgi:thiol-disulfide isomerase/thioredoxin